MAAGSASLRDATHVQRAYLGGMTASGGPHGRRHYAHERLATTLAYVYLGIVVLSAVPFATEVVSGTNSGGFGFVWMILATAPLSFVTIILINVIPALAESDGISAMLLAAAIVVPALVNAWFVWRIFRGPTVIPDGSPAPSIR